MERKFPIGEEDGKELVGQIIDIFESFLDERGIVLTHAEGGANICGSDYDALQVSLDDTMRNWQIVRKRCRHRKKNGMCGKKPIATASGSCETRCSYYECAEVRELVIKPEDALRIEADLSPDSDPKQIRERYGRDYTENHTVCFDDHMEMDIKICISSPDEDETENPLWTEAVLFRDGYEVAHTDAETRFFGIWELKWNNTCYIVNIIK